MTNAALFDATQKTPEEIPYRAAILFYKEKYIFLHVKAVIKWCQNFKIMRLFYHL